MKELLITLGVVFIIFITGLIFSAVNSFRAENEKSKLKDSLPLITARQRQFNTKAQRDADKLDESLVTVLIVT